MRNHLESKITGLGLLKSIIIFASASLLLFIGTHYFIPLFSEASGLEPIIFWFIVASFFVFIPLIIIGYFMLKKEGQQIDLSLLKSRLRFTKMNKADWLWAIGGLVIIGLLSGLIMEGLKLFVDEVNSQPSFMYFKPLTPERYWILALWLPYWIFNIGGEEFLWRGVILPKQEISFGNNAWLVQGTLWGVFHIAFGWQLLITLLPILFILPYIVQKRKNSWIGVIIHTGLNGPSFLAISFGLLN